MSNERIDPVTAPTEATLSEPRHDDFKKILDNFIRQYGEEKGTRLFYAWVNKHGLDDTKPYSVQAQLLNECVGPLCEAFRWVEPLIRFYREDGGAKYYKAKALTANVSMNKNDYEDAIELARAAPTLGWRPLNINHDHKRWLPFPEARADMAAFEDNAVETILRIPDTLPEIQRQIEDGEIMHVSIEGEPRGGVKTEKGRAPKYYNFTALALLERDKTLPGDPLTSLEPLFLRESMGRSLVESLSLEKTTKVKNMDGKPSKVTVKLVTEAKWTRKFINDLPNSAFAVIEPAYTRGDTDNKNARHLPYKGEGGKVDLPHLRAALARMNQIKPVTDSISAAALQAGAKRVLVAQAKKLLPNSQWAQEAVEEGIQGMDVCGQCKFFTDLSNVIVKVDHLTGAEDSREVTRLGGAIGPGVGLCQVTKQLVRKADSACTDGRPREAATDLDRTKESIGEIILKGKISDLEEKNLRTEQAKIREITEHAKTNQKNTELADKNERVARELAVERNKNVRLKGRLRELETKLDDATSGLAELDVNLGKAKGDVAFYKETVKGLEEKFEVQKKTIAEAKEETARALTKMNDESTKRATAVQEAINAEQEKGRLSREVAELTERVSELTREVSDVAQIRAEQARRNLGDQTLIKELREKNEEKTTTIRGLKRRLSKMPKRILVKT